MLKVTFVADQTVPRITDVFKKTSKKSGLEIKIVEDSSIDVMQDLKDLTFVTSKVRNFKFFQFRDKLLKVRGKKLVKTQRYCIA